MYKYECIIETDFMFYSMSFVFIYVYRCPTDHVFVSDGVRVV
jgi:hypothetical protein